MRFSALFFLLTLIPVFLSPAGAQNYEIGSTTIVFTDSAREERNIETRIYYPAVTQGTDVPVAAGNFPVIVFGHGFVMVTSAYEYLWDSLVQLGYICAFPATETGFSPSHTDQAGDLLFLVTQFRKEDKDPNSMFFQKISPESAIMGHSMGGGSSFLACRNTNLPSAMVTFAAANTSPSAIKAARDIKIPCLLFAGGNDCITTPEQHQLPMYHSLASDCKIFVNIMGGSHCYFADNNVLCSLGEKNCSPAPAISREQQHTITFGILIPFLDATLMKKEDSLNILSNTLHNSPWITFLARCSSDKGILIRE